MTSIIRRRQKDSNLDSCSAGAGNSLPHGNGEVSKTTWIVARAGILLVLVAITVIHHFRHVTSQSGYVDVAIAATNSKVIHTDDSPGVKIAWLMSFPNSGTSYTLGAMRSASRHYTASNYGDKPKTWVDEFGNSRSVHENEAAGPFWLGLIKPKITVPSTYVMTKTHCSGYGNAPIRHAVETLESFLLGCRSGFRRFINEHGMPKTQSVSYSTNRVRKAIHLFRNPIDNVVARFHCEVTNKDPNVLDTREGFLQHCRKSNQDFGTKQELSQYIDPIAVEALENVPCRSEFFLYAQWHNLAFAATEHLAIPTHILYYESYSSHLNETVSGILDFLDQERRGDPPDFIKGKQYSLFYSQPELDSVQIAMEAMSSPETWRHIRHYFE